MRDLPHALADAAIHATIASAAVGAVWWRLGLKMAVVGY